MRALILLALLCACGDDAPATVDRTPVDRAPALLAGQLYLPDMTERLVEGN